MIDQNIEILKELRQKYQSVVVELNKVIADLESDNLTDCCDLEESVSGDIAFRDLSNTLRRIKSVQSIELIHNKSKAAAMTALHKQNEDKKDKGRP